MGALLEYFWMLEMGVLDMPLFEAINLLLSDFGAL